MAMKFISLPGHGEIGEGICWHHGFGACSREIPIFPGLNRQRVLRAAFNKEPFFMVVGEAEGSGVS
jgi:hypothetical protein